MKKKTTINYMVSNTVILLLLSVLGIVLFVLWLLHQPMRILEKALLRLMEKVYNQLTRAMLKRQRLKS